jgi:hypothetical protein
LLRHGQNIAIDENQLPVVRSTSDNPGAASLLPQASGLSRRIDEPKEFHGPLLKTSHHLLAALFNIALKPGADSTVRDKLFLRAVGLKLYAEPQKAAKKPSDALTGPHSLCRILGVRYVTANHENI